MLYSLNASKAETQLYLSHIKLSNFRLFQDLDLELNRGLNVLVGENDSGKTSIIDAICFVLGTRSHDRRFLKETDFFTDSNELRIQLTFADVVNHAHRFVEHLSNSDHAGQPVLHVQLRAWQTGLERRGYPYIRTEIKSGHDGNGPLLETEIRDFLSATYLKPLRDAEDELSSGRGSRLSQILSSSKSVYKEMGDILKIVAAANQELLKDGGALKAETKKIESDYLHNLIFEVSKKELGAHVNISGAKVDNSGNLIEVSESERKSQLRAILEKLSLNLTGDSRVHGLGYHNLLFMASELLLLEQETENEFPLLLIEEPEAHLHPQLQMKLLGFLNERTSEQSESNIQCILTTHSPNISSKADPSQIFILNSGNAWSLRAGETELASDDYGHLRKFLDVTKANVFFAKGILFVEGASEQILLPVLAKLLGKPLEAYGVSVVKYDNSGSWKRFASIFLRKKNGENEPINSPVKVCILRDLDLWPDVAEKEKAHYGFKERKEGNSHYWLNFYQNKDELQNAVNSRVRMSDKSLLLNPIANSDNDDSLNTSFEKQNVRMELSDDWTFEYCLAKYGMLDECLEVLGKSPSDCEQGDENDKAVFVQSVVNSTKTDFAYDLAKILEDKLHSKIADLGKGNDIAISSVSEIKTAYARELRQKLPPYIVRAIEFVTSENKLG